jgi:flagellar protein FlgJ
MSVAAFIDVVAPIAVRLRLEGSPIFPSLRIAQAGLETGWKLTPWNNLVGLKVGSRPPNAYWKGDYVNKETWEVVSGKRIDVVEAFRAYDSVEDGFRDQDELFMLPRYAGVRTARTPEEQAEQLLAGGYATDPAYADKIKGVIRQYGLKRYDEEVIRVLEALQKQIQTLQDRIAVLEAQHVVAEMPSWARQAVDAAVASGVVDTPEAGSYDFYRLITVMHRLGLFSKSN